MIITRLKKIGGFTLAEVMIGTAILGAVSLGVMQLINQQTKVQVRAEATYEINAVSSAIATVFRDPDTCVATFAPLGNLKNKLIPLTQITTDSGRVLFTKGQKYGGLKVGATGNGNVILSDLNFENFVVKPDPIPAGKTGYGELLLTITLTKAGKILTSDAPRTGPLAPELDRLVETRTVPLKVSVDSNYVVTSCYSATENAVADALKKACASISGTFNETTRRCELKVFPQNPVNHTTAVSTQYLNDFTSDYDTRYVDAAGDTMTGGLNVQANVLSAQSIADALVCVGGRCRNFGEKRCATGNVVTGVAEDGSVICRTLSCPITHYVAGFDAAGNSVCRQLPTTTCGTGQYVSAIGADGSVTCKDLPPNVAMLCPNGQYLQSISSVGGLTCVPVPIDTNTNIFGRQCGSSLGIVTGIDGAGNLQCIDYCPACGACGKRRPVGISCSPYGSPINGEDECRVSGWTRISNPWCYCPCGSCGAEQGVWGSCSFGALQWGVDRCVTSGWVRVANPWCWCACGTCGATRTVWVGTVPKTQWCDTNGWRY